MKYATRSLLALTFSLSLMACADDAPDTGVDSNALCDCTPQTAVTVAYDNNGSALADTNVQGAVDELAARAEGKADAWGRITLETMVVTSPSAGTGHSAVASCPGTAPNVGRALGGSCEGGDGLVSLQGTELGGSFFTCIWNKPEGQAIEFTAKVTCLAQAE